MKEYVFTFGIGMPLAGHYIRIQAESYGAARQRMFELYGTEWAFQYYAEDWDRKVAMDEYGHIRYEKQYGETIIAPAESLQESMGV